MWAENKDKLKRVQRGHHPVVTVNDDDLQVRSVNKYNYFIYENSSGYEIQKKYKSNFELHMSN